MLRTSLQRTQCFMLATSLQRRLPLIYNTSRAFSKTLTDRSPLVELREYALHPGHAHSYIAEAAAAADLRKSLSPLRFFSMPETGGQLHVATHTYFYEGGYVERNRKRAAMATDDDWQAYIATCLPHVQSMSSMLFVEAPLVQQHDGICGLSSVPDELAGDSAILELRRYQLVLGYDTVPRFLEHYGSGIDSKLGNKDPTTTLLTVLHSEVGPLNQVLEVWRHGNGTAAMEASRQAGRQAIEWRQAIAKVAGLAQTFTSTIHKPTAFSPIQ